MTSSHCPARGGHGLGRPSFMCRPSAAGWARKSQLNSARCIVLSAKDKAFQQMSADRRKIGERPFGPKAQRSTLTSSTAGADDAGTSSQRPGQRRPMWLTPRHCCTHVLPVVFPDITVGPSRCGSIRWRPPAVHLSKVCVEHLSNTNSNQECTEMEAAPLSDSP